MPLGNEVWILKRSTTPADSELAAAGQSLWIDTSSTPTLKILTSISPITWAAITGGSGAPTDAEYLVGSLNGGLSAERVVTNTATISWDLSVGSQAKAQIVSASISDSLIDATGITTRSKLPSALAYEDEANTFTLVQTLTPSARSSGTAPYFVINQPADTGLTASTEAIGLSMVGATRTHATGALAEQREIVLGAPTYAFDGASTITRAINLYVPTPNAGTNATLTSSYGLLVEASNAAHVPIAVRAAASQTGDLLRFTDSAHTILMRVANSGVPFAPATGYSWTTQTGSRIGTFSTTYVIHYQAGTEVFGITTTHLESSKPIKFNSAGITTSIDTHIRRSAAGEIVLGNGTNGQWGSGLKLGHRDGGTTTVTDSIVVGHQSTGTPAAGLGSAILYNINSDTTADQNAARCAALWTTATHASRTADYIISLTNNAAALAEKFRVRADGFYKTSAGNKRVGTQVDKTNATLSDLTDLSETLTAGRTYGFYYELYVDASAVGGSKYAVAGTATATSITYQVQLVDNNTNAFTINSRQTALGGAGVGQAGSTAAYVVISGTIVVNAGGTLVPQFAQNTANGTSSVLVNSRGQVWEI